MRATNKRLTIFTEEMRSALYDLPGFDEVLREEYLLLTENERALAFNRSDITNQIYCIFQISFFKAKQFFFSFTLKEVGKTDLSFALDRYFSNTKLNQFKITDYEYYEQCRLITGLFGYKRWSKDFSPMVMDYLIKLSRNDITLDYLVMELLAFLQKEKIIRPKYTTLQTIISEILQIEKQRLSDVIQKNLSEKNKLELIKLLDKDETLSNLAALKQDAKGFKPHMLINEREKLALLKPHYNIAKVIIPKLNISKQNLHYYSSLAIYYNAYELRKKLLPELTHLYLLCYIFQRYQQLNDNFIEAFCFLLNQLNKETKETAKEEFLKYSSVLQNENVVMKKLARFYVDDKISDEIVFGQVRKKVFKIVPKDELRNQVSPENKTKKQVDFKWEAIDKQTHRLRNILHPLIGVLDLDSERADLPWLKAVTWIKKLSSEQKSLEQCDITDCPEKTIPKKLERYFFEKNTKGNLKLQANRYEFWIYRQLKKRIQSGEIVKLPFTPMVLNGVFCI